jgi:hypothetical protein
LQGFDKLPGLGPPLLTPAYLPTDENDEA